MKARIIPLVCGVLIGIVALTATNGLLAAQQANPAADQTTTLLMATPSATDAAMAGKMDQMMDECLAMMSMMGGDMGGMMGGEEMQGMMGMGDTPAAATPGA